MKPQVTRSIILLSIVILAIAAFFVGTSNVVKKAAKPPQTQEISLFSPITSNEVTSSVKTSFMAMSMSDHPIDDAAIHTQFTFVYTVNMQTNQVIFELSTSNMDPFQSKMSSSSNTVVYDKDQDVYIYTCYEYDNDPVFLYLFKDRIMLKYPKDFDEFAYYTFFNSYN